MKKRGNKEWDVFLIICSLGHRVWCQRPFQLLKILQHISYIYNSGRYLYCQKVTAFLALDAIGWIALFRASDVAQMYN